MKTLNDILAAHDQEVQATTAGSIMHERLRNVVIDGDTVTGDQDLIEKIIVKPELVPFFTATSKTEVPIAGILDGDFVSRRLDRIKIDDATKEIWVLDYKTDTDSQRFHDKYIAQIHEYVALLHMIYPGYKIRAYILWTHDFSLENITLKSV